MRFTETMRVTILSCDRCDTRINENAHPHGWLIGSVALSEAPTATTEHHLCPDCRDALGTWMANEPVEDDSHNDGPPHFCERCNSGEHGETDRRGVCACCNTIVDIDGFEAYRRERARLGI